MTTPAPPDQHPGTAETDDDPLDPAAHPGLGEPTNDKDDLANADVSGGGVSSPEPDTA